MAADPCLLHSLHSVFVKHVSVDDSRSTAIMYMANVFKNTLKPVHYMYHIEGHGELQGCMLMQIALFCTQLRDTCTYILMVVHH